MDMSEACPDIYDEGYIHQFQPETTAAAAQFKDILTSLYEKPHVYGICLK